jgi:hypothetical protein
MNVRLNDSVAPAKRARLVLALGFLFGLFATNSAFAELATPEQKRACTPDVYRLCAGEIPNVKAITACLRRQKANLSEACRAVFEQRGE